MEWNHIPKVIDMTLSYKSYVQYIGYYRVLVIHQSLRPLSQQKGVPSANWWRFLMHSEALSGFKLIDYNKLRNFWLLSNKM